jgi:hypothetical protein
MHSRDSVDLHAVPAGAKCLRMFFVRLFDTQISFVRLLEHFCPATHAQCADSPLSCWVVSFGFVDGIKRAILSLSADHKAKSALFTGNS